MRLHARTLALSLLLGCHSYEPPAPVLTLVPAALRVTTGPAQAIDDHTLCLMAGASAEVPVYLEPSTVKISVTASTLTPEAPPGLAVHLGERPVANDTIQGTQAEAFVYRTTEVARGEHLLRLMVPESTPRTAVLCLHQVVVTQP